MCLHMSDTMIHMCFVPYNRIFLISSRNMAKSVENPYERCTSHLEYYRLAYRLCLAASFFNKTVTVLLKKMAAKQ